MAHIQLQALSSGLPTVATEESGFLDIKKTLNNVYLGELTKSGNKKELLKSILLCEKKRSFTFNSKLYLHKELNKKLSWKSYSERYLKFLDSLSLNN
jgi:glycosyltransferase involved in cell wall biosynthesis